MLARYAATWIYLTGFILADLAFAALSPHDQSAVMQWASTNVSNLRHDPMASLVASAFIPSMYAAAWPPLIAVAVFGANQALGNWRTVVACVSGHVFGTLASEGVVAYKIAHGLLPASSAHILDVGPSYIVVSAITVAVLYGSRLARIAAALGFVGLVFIGHIFSGLSALQVSAVGHAVAIVSSALIGSLLVWQARRSRHDSVQGLPAA